MSDTRHDLHERYERASRRAERLGWVVRKDPLQPLYMLESIDDPESFRPPGPQRRFAFTLDDVDRELDDIDAGSEFF